MAFKWADRRAFYRCYCCFQKRKIFDFASAVAFEKHMERHPDFTMVREEEEEEAQVSVMESKEKELFRELEPADFGPDISDTDGIEDNTSVSDIGLYDPRARFESSQRQETVKTNRAVSTVYLESTWEREPQNFTTLCCEYLAYILPSLKCFQNAPSNLGRIDNSTWRRPARPGRISNQYAGLDYSHKD
jgi:hypothetical protein